MRKKFSKVLVPQGSEYLSVCKGLLEATNKPKVIATPLGGVIKEFLATLEIEGSILVLGVAGGLSKELKQGDVVSYKKCSLWQKGRIESKLTCENTYSDNMQIKQVEGITSDQLITTPIQKERLSEYGEVVDMESYLILERFPSATIVRVISDNSQQRIPDLSRAITPQGRLDRLKLTQAFLKEPLAAGHLIYSSLQALDRLKSITRDIFTQ